MAERRARKNVHFPAHVMTYLATSNRSLSGRVSSIVDRYREALRRSEPIAGHFSDTQLTDILAATDGLDLDPAARLFGDDIGLAVLEYGGTQDLIKRLAALDPWQQIQLTEWIETERQKEAHHD